MQANPLAGAQAKANDGDAALNRRDPCEAARLFIDAYDDAESILGDALDALEQTLMDMSVALAAEDFAHLGGIIARITRDASLIADANVLLASIRSRALEALEKCGDLEFEQGNMMRAMELYTNALLFVDGEDERKRVSHKADLARDLFHDSERERDDHLMKKASGG